MESIIRHIAGGTIVETVADSIELYKRGLLNSEYDSCAAVRNNLHEMGYGGYVDNGGMANGNIYTDKDGNTISRKQFWKNFDKENNTKIIRGSQLDPLKDALRL
ncbi:hypothetical protein [Selenomonas ruminantium]|uniref:Uncharacterized protein n=1 Tax=Selenomonas ruminantium TaxID=971 RepID=A0A1I0W9P7_SELRU|nr:hypothetical protein [Selenomonas ruminantium]SFA85485.1 hypothetical protein SAMN05216587_102343 [Selenomonas ruminantium]